MELSIYIADLNAYNEGILKGEWLELPTEEEEIKEAINRQNNNGVSDYAIHDYILPFSISEYEDIYKINELCESIQNLKITEGIINHIEYSTSTNIKDMDYMELKEAIEEIQIIEASTNKEFAENYIQELYGDKIEMLPWEIAYSIDYYTVFDKLSMTMDITQDREENIYYYSYK